MKPQKKVMSAITILILILFQNIVYAQNDSIKNKKTKHEYGPDKTHFAYAYFNFTFPVMPPENNDAEIFYGKSHTLSFGARYKIKILGIFSLGTGFYYARTAWHFKQNNDKKIPSSEIYDKEKLVINSAGTDIFFRFKFGKNKKSPLGNYIDLGTYGEWNFNDKRIFKNYVNGSDTEGFETFTGTEKRLNFLNKTNFGFEVRLGYGKIILFSKYRMSDMFSADFKNEISNTELQRLSTGIEIGLHK